MSKSKEPWLKKPADWPIDLHLINGEVKRGAKFYGTERQLKAHLRILNSVGIGGRWVVGEYQC